MKTLNEQVQELEEILKEKQMSFKSVSIENGFIKELDLDGDICYYTPDLKSYTKCGKCIELENGFVKVTHQNEDVRYYIHDLKSFTPWVKFITTENGFVKLTRKDEKVKYYTPNLKHSTTWGDYDSIYVENGIVKVNIKVIKYSSTLEKL